MKRSLSVGSVVSAFGVALALGWTIPAMAHKHPTLYVSNIEELYAAVNNPSYAGAVVLLAPGIYTLSTTDPHNQNRPNGGSLVLQPGMGLVGQNRYVDFDGDGIWDPRDDNRDGVPDTDPVRGLIYADPASETIIDAFNLPSGNAIKVGLDNRVKKLTVRNTNNLTSAIDVSLVPASGGMRVEIRDCLLEDGQRGIRLAHPMRGGSNLDSSAVLERNISRRHLGFYGFGVQIIHVGPTTNSSWDVVMRNNLLDANRFGLFVVGENIGNVRSQVLSMRNVYRENELGLRIDVGRDGANGNYTQFTSIDDRILDNIHPSSEDSPAGGGVWAHAGLNTDATAPQSSNNVLDLQFLGTIWGGNFNGPHRQDLQVYGARSVAGLPGTNDTARVLIRHATSDGAAGAFQFIDSQPVDTSNTDAVTIIGSNIAFTHTTSN
jgi:hypothetical protein